jgi:hypothetical protein
MDTQTSINLKSFPQRNKRKLVPSPNANDDTLVRVADVTRSGFTYVHPKDGVCQMAFRDMSTLQGQMILKEITCKGNESIVK